LPAAAATNCDRLASGASRQECGHYHQDRERCGNAPVYLQKGTHLIVLRSFRPHVCRVSPDSCLSNCVQGRTDIPQNKRKQEVIHGVALLTITRSVADAKNQYCISVGSVFKSRWQAKRKHYLYLRIFVER
jgi:hypothetical protein